MMIAKSKHAWILGGMALVATAWFALERPEYMKGVSYHATNNIVLDNGSEVLAEARLIVGDTLNFSLLDKSGADESLASVAAKVEEENSHRLTVKIEKTSNSSTSSFAELSSVPDVLFGREYALAEGATLHFEFFPVPGNKAICYYTKEYDQVLCLNR